MEAKMHDGRYFLFANPEKAASIAAARSLACLLTASDAELLADEWLCKEIPIAEKCELNNIDHSISAIICLGGDGTLLRAIPAAAKNDVPILGINLGNIGFLLEVDKPNLENVVKSLTGHDYYLERRMLLSCSSDCIGSVLVMNDVVLSRGLCPSIVTVRAYAGDELIFACKGDGVLVSTPTGTTGYALSAGGPIISPQVPCILIMPICTRVMHQRPVILHQDQLIRLCPEASGTKTLLLTMDGQNIAGVGDGCEIRIRRADETASFIRFTPQHFLERLRQKQAEWSKE
jgi:NAD+ kinase